MTNQERNPFEKLALNDPGRPIEILGTEEAGVPEDSKRFLDHRIDRVKFPNGNEGWYHRIILPEGVMVGHIDDNEQVALVKTYRHSMGRYSVELPSGGAEPEEEVLLQQATPEEKEEILKEMARREFSEEVGLDIDPENIDRLYPGPLQGSPGFAEQTYHTYFSEGGRVSKQNLDDGEAGMLTSQRRSLEDAGEMINLQMIVEPVSVAAIQALANIYGKKINLLSRKSKKTIV